MDPDILLKNGRSAGSPAVSAASGARLPGVCRIRHRRRFARPLCNLTFITGARSAGSWRRDLLVCWLRAASLRTRPWLGLSCDGVVPAAAATRRMPLPAEVLGLQDAHLEEVFPAVGVELGLPANALVAEAACLVAPDGPVVSGQYLQFDPVRA